MFNDNETPEIFAEGVLEIQPDGYGFLRSLACHFLPGPDDVYLSKTQIHAFNLRTGDTLTGQVRPPGEGETHFGMVRIDSVNWAPIQLAGIRPRFEVLTKSRPRKRLRMETIRDNLCGRVIDLMSPLGLGQSGLIIASGYLGQQAVLEALANALAVNHPEVEVVMILIGRHREEAEAMRRCLKAEVAYATEDDSFPSQVHLAEFVLEWAKRQVESGRNVVILLDSITNLARAYEGLALQTGPDSIAQSLRRAKGFLESATDSQESGSLSVFAILEQTDWPSETETSEVLMSGIDVRVVLSPKVLAQGVFPAIDIHRSATRGSELMVPAADLSRVWILRKVLEPLGAGEGAKLLGGKLLRTRSNRQFLENMSSL